MLSSVLFCFVEECVAELFTPETQDLEVQGSTLTHRIVSLDKELYAPLFLFTQVYKWVLAIYYSVADRDLQIRRGGHPDLEIRGGRSPKKFFQLFGPHFGRKKRGPLGPLPWICHCCWGGNPVMD